MAISNKDAKVFDWWALKYLANFYMSRDSMHSRSYKQASKLIGHSYEFILNNNVTHSDLLRSLYE